LAVARNGAGCVVQDMMRLGKWGIPLIREIVLIICEFKILVFCAV
jgi:hypothetical protein